MQSYVNSAMMLHAIMYLYYCCCLLLYVLLLEGIFFCNKDVAVSFFWVFWIWPPWAAGMTACKRCKCRMRIQVARLDLYSGSTHEENEPVDCRSLQEKWPLKKAAALLEPLPPDPSSFPTTLHLYPSISLVYKQVTNRLVPLYSTARLSVL